MLLCLDVGNTHILAGVFDQEKLVLRFRYATHLLGTSDQLGVFFTNILQTNNVPAIKISAVAVCSVVPSCDFTIHHMITHYFFKAKYFVLKVGIKTGLNIKYKNPNEVGADRIANAIGAIDALPRKNIIIVDMGTATTIDLVTKTHDYLGGAVMPGIRLCMEALKANTAKLMAVDIEAPKNTIGRTTRESIQSGLYYGQLGAIKELIAGIKREAFKTESVTIIATGGFSQLFKDQPLFDLFIPDLVLQGLKKAYENSN